MPPSLKQLKSFFSKAAVEEAAVAKKIKLAEKAKLDQMKVRKLSTAADSSLAQSLREGKKLTAMPTSMRPSSLPKKPVVLAPKKPVVPAGRVVPGHGYVPAGRTPGAIVPGHGYVPSAQERARAEEKKKLQQAAADKKAHEAALASAKSHGARMEERRWPTSAPLIDKKPQPVTAIDRRGREVVVTPKNKDFVSQTYDKAAYEAHQATLTKMKPAVTQHRTTPTMSHQDMARRDEKLGQEREKAKYAAEMRQFEAEVNSGFHNAVAGKNLSQQQLNDLSSKYRGNARSLPPTWKTDLDADIAAAKAKNAAVRKDVEAARDVAARYTPDQRLEALDAYEAKHGKARNGMIGGKMVDIDKITHEHFTAKKAVKQIDVAKATGVKPKVAIDTETAGILKERAAWESQIKELNKKLKDPQYKEYAESMRARRDLLQRKLDDAMYATKQATAKAERAAKYPRTMWDEGD